MTREGAVRLAGWLGPPIAVAAFSLIWVPPADTYWHLAAGREILEQGGLLERDPFSFTAGDHRWINHEWLAEILFYGIYQLGGWWGLYAFRTLAVVLSFTLLPMLMSRAPVLTGWVTLAALYLGQAERFLDVRAYLFTYLFLALTFFLASRYAASAKARDLALPVVVVAVWANCHGAYILGPVALGLAAVGISVEDRRVGSRGGTLMGTACAGMLLALLNPYGAEIWLFPFSLLEKNAYTLGLNEWSRPDLLGSQAGYLGLLALGVGLIGYAAKRRPWMQAAWFAFFGATGVAAWRHEPLAALAVCYLAARCLGKSEPADGGPSGNSDLADSGRSGDGWLFPAAAVLALGASLLWLGFRLAPGPEQWSYRRQLFPVYALEFLKANPKLPQRIANPYEWGGFLGWHLGPAGRVMIDGRAHTAFPEAVYRDALHLQFGEPWIDLLERKGLAGNEPRAPWQAVPDRYGVDLLLASRLQGDLPRRLEGSKDWRLIYSDHLSGIYLRDKPEYRDRIWTYPVTPPALLERAVRSLREKKRQECEQDLRTALEMDPTLPFTRYYLALLAHDRGETAEALRLVDQELELNPRNRAAQELRRRLIEPHN